jgi:hypothetical protein
MGTARVAHMAEAKARRGHSHIDAARGPNLLATVDWV